MAKSRFTYGAYPNVESPQGIKVKYKSSIKAFRSIIRHMQEHGELNFIINGKVLTIKPIPGSEPSQKSFDQYFRNAQEDGRKVKVFEEPCFHFDKQLTSWREYRPINPHTHKHFQPLTHKYDALFKADHKAEWAPPTLAAVKDQHVTIVFGSNNEACRRLHRVYRDHKRGYLFIQTGFTQETITATRPKHGQSPEQHKHAKTEYDKLRKRPVDLVELTHFQVCNGRLTIFGSKEELGNLHETTTQHLTGRKMHGPCSPFQR